MKQAYITLVTSLGLATMVSVSLAQDVAMDPEDVRLGKAEYSPYLDQDYPDRVYFGDTHVHTSYWTDAGMFGTRLGPEEAYRFALGEEVTSNTGLRVRLQRPLDFLVIAGLYGNSGAEAIYPTYFTDNEGVPLNAAEHSYVMRFDAGGLPPAKAFWSLSMYDGPTQLFINNPLDRYLVTSTMIEDFVFEDDGSLLIHVQKNSPGADREANWLPAPEGPFYLALRLYVPEQRVLDGQWAPPELSQSH